MSDTIVKVLPYRVDLAKPVKKTYLETLFATQDNEAHQIDVQLFRDKAQLTLPSGAAVSAYFIRYIDNATVPLQGSASGNVASVTLSKACYNKAGQFALIIKVLIDNVISTVFYGEGSIFTSSTDILVDEENIIPSLEDLLAQIAVMEAATKDAKSATDNANTAADAANTAADNANGAAGKIDGMTVSAEKADEAGATITEVNGVKHIAFALPKGDKGDKGDPGTIENVSVNSITGLPEALNELNQAKADVANWTAGKNVVTDATGKLTTENKPTIPTALPNPHALTINGQTYDGSEEVEVNVSEGGALYTNLADNSDFEHWVSQTALGANHGTQVYGGDRWMLTSGTIAGNANDDGDGYSGITLNGTLVQVVPSPPAVATAFVEMVSGTATISYDATKGEIILTSAGGVIKNVLLLEGEWAEKPKYVAKGYAQELMECYRYYYLINSFDYGYIGIGNAYESTKAWFAVNTPIRMRVKPTTSIPNFYGDNGAGMQCLGSNPSVHGMVGNVLYCLCTINTDMVSKGQIVFRLQTDGAYAVFYADLARRG